MVILRSIIFTGVLLYCFVCLFVYLFVVVVVVVVVVFNPRTYKLIHTRTVVQGGMDGAPSWVFAALQHFENILP